METEAPVSQETSCVMNQTKPPQHCIGSRLKSAREAMKLSEKEVAARLYLKENIIQLMEGDRFHEGPPATFMRGYIKSYAKLVNFPESEIQGVLKALDNQVQPSSQPTVSLISTHTVNKTDRYLRWISYLLVLSLVALVALWWNSHVRSNINDELPKTAVPVAATVIPVPEQAASANNNMTAPVSAPPAALPQPGPVAPNANPATPDPVDAAKAIIATPPAQAEAKNNRAAGITMAVPEPGLEGTDDDLLN